MKVNIDILVENTTPAAPLLGEYGFAALVTVDDFKFLFDTGSDKALFINSSILGLDIGEVRNIIISHGHYDHSGALIAYLKKYGGRKVYVHPAVFCNRFIAYHNTLKNIGCPFSREEAENLGASFEYVQGFTSIYPGVYLTGEVPRLKPYENVGGNFKVEINGQYENDMLPDDMAMVIDHPAGLIIISGCSHSGMINIIDYAIKETGRKEVQAYIGGTHLIKASEERLQQTIAAVEKYNVKQLIVGHCTGFYPAARLYNELGARVIKVDAGMSFIY